MSSGADGTRRGGNRERKREKRKKQRNALAGLLKKLWKQWSLECSVIFSKRQELMENKGKRVPHIGFGEKAEHFMLTEQEVRVKGMVRESDLRRGSTKETGGYESRKLIVRGGTSKCEKGGGWYKLRIVERGSICLGEKTGVWGRGPEAGFRGKKERKPNPSGEGGIGVKKGTSGGGELLMENFLFRGSSSKKEQTNSIHVKTLKEKMLHGERNAVQDRRVTRGRS